MGCVVLANEWQVTSKLSGSLSVLHLCFGLESFCIIRDCVKRQRNAYWPRSVEISLISSWNETLQTISHPARDSLSLFRGHENVFAPGIWLGHLLSVCSLGMCWLPCTYIRKLHFTQSVLVTPASSLLSRSHFVSCSLIWMFAFMNYYYLWTHFEHFDYWLCFLHYNIRPIALCGKPVRVLVISVALLIPTGPLGSLHGGHCVNLSHIQSKYT